MYVCILVRKTLVFTNISSRFSIQAPFDLNRWKQPCYGFLIYIEIYIGGFLVLIFPTFQISISPLKNWNGLLQYIKKKGVESRI